MTNLNFRGRWNELRGKLKQANAKLTDDDLQYQEGKEEEVIGRIQQRLGQSREQVVNWINTLDQGSGRQSPGNNNSNTNQNRGNQNRGNQGNNPR